MAERFLTDIKRFFFCGLAAVLLTRLTLDILFAVPAPLGASHQGTPYSWWVGFVLSLVGIHVFGRFVVGGGVVIPAGAGRCRCQGRRM